MRCGPRRARRSRLFSSGVLSPSPIRAVSFPVSDARRSVGSGSNRSTFFAALRPSWRFRPYLDSLKSCA
jgi:hypothetical protein